MTFPGTDPDAFVAKEKVAYPGAVQG